MLKDGASTFGAGGILRDAYAVAPTPLRPPARIGGFGVAQRIGKKPLSRGQIAAIKEKDKGR